MSWYFILTALLLKVVGDTALTTWPKGPFGMLKPISGCPTGWSDKGWIFQDTEDDNPSNERSELLHMDGFVVPSNVLTYFCIKTTDVTELNWPQGKYCIYRKNGRTLKGMKWGTIRMHDEDDSAYKDTYAYTYKILAIWTRNSQKYTEFYFQCYTSGDKNIPISLPITKPFYLLPYGSRDCQQVKWMVATTEWIKYHTRNYDDFDHYQKGGHVPYHKLGKSSNKGITMYYCYYESCNHTLTDKEGVFQSPGFPDEYPDGQLCSWRIMVPDNHTLHVQFTDFSMDESAKSDNLTFLTFADGSFHLNDTFHGHYNQPFTIIETNDVVFEFLTNEEGHSTGFRAEYTVFNTPVPPETTPSPQPTTRTNGHTTTIIPITPETKNQTINSTNDNFKKSRVSECDGADTTILIVIPLICLIVVIAIVIIVLYQWRSKKTKCEKCASTRYPKDVALNPTYDDAGRIQLHQRTSTATMDTALGTDDNDGQMYETLSRDKQPEYQAHDYSKQNGANDPSMNSELPEYHELESMGNNVPDVVYDVLEGPDSNGRPSGDQMYQALDKQTTHNPLYQSTSPATMVTTRNPMYVDSVA